ncbi:hypothetical protein ACFL35_20425 [Candidatus Riflebacteria bacterium]
MRKVFLWIAFFGLPVFLQAGGEQKYEFLIEQYLEEMAGPYKEVFQSYLERVNELEAKEKQKQLQYLRLLLPAGTSAKKIEAFLNWISEQKADWKKIRHLVSYYLTITKFPFRKQKDSLDTLQKLLKGFSATGLRELMYLLESKELLHGGCLAFLDFLFKRLKDPEWPAHEKELLYFLRRLANFESILHARLENLIESMEKTTIPLKLAGNIFKNCNRQPDLERMQVYIIATTALLTRVKDVKILQREINYLHKSVLRNPIF